METSKPLSGILMLAVAVGLAWAWTHGKLDGASAKISELLASPKRPSLVVLQPIDMGRAAGERTAS